MKLLVNGESMEAPDGVTVAMLIARRGHPATVAVAVNQVFVPRSRHVDTILKEGDQVEIVAPMQGG